MKALKTFVLATAFLACSFLTTAYSAVDMFLELDGIKGESEDPTHKGQIEILSFSWGVAQTRASGAGGGAGKASFQDLHFTTNPNRSSPALFIACASGQHIKKATLFVRKAGGQQEEYYKVTLSDVLVSSFTDGGGADDEQGALAESISFNFTKIEFEYMTQSGEVVKAGWDLKANKKV